MKRIAHIIICMFVLCITITLALPLSPVMADQDKSAMLHSEGNVLYNGRGESVRLLGVNIPSMEWTPKGENMLESVDKAIVDWNSNCIRLPVSTKFWFGSGSNEGETYRKAVDEVVEKIVSYGAYVILDNHNYIIPSEEDRDFWISAAERYKNHPYVLFGLLNEPHNVSDEDLVKGTKNTITYTDSNSTIEIHGSPGLQGLVDAIRDTGARNMLVAGGNDWAYDISFVLEGLALDDKGGNGIIYETHPYSWKDNGNYSMWKEKFLNTAEKYPVLVGECGVSQDPQNSYQPDMSKLGTYWDALTSVMDEYSLNLTAWCFHWSAGPNLLGGEGAQPTYKPSKWGEVVKEYLEQAALRDGVLMLHKTKNFGSEPVKFKEGSYTAEAIQQTGIEPAGIASLDIARNYSVTFYSDDNFKGTGWTFIGSVPDLSTFECNGKIKSMKIERKPVSNIALNKPAYSNDKSSKPAKAVDGKSFSWKSDIGVPAWVGLDLQGTYIINRWVVKHAGAAGDVDLFNTVDFKLQTSMDGKTWIDVDSVTGNKLNATDRIVPQFTARYIKLDILKPNSAGLDIYKKSSNISELELYGIKTGDVSLDSQALSADEVFGQATGETITPEPSAAKQESTMENKTETTAAVTDSPDKSQEEKKSPPYAAGGVIISVLVLGAAAFLFREQLFKMK